MVGYGLKVAILALLLTLGLLGLGLPAKVIFRLQGATLNAELHLPSAQNNHL